MDLAFPIVHHRRALHNSLLLLLQPLAPESQLDLNAEEEELKRKLEELASNISDKEVSSEEEECEEKKRVKKPEMSSSSDDMARDAQKVIYVPLPIPFWAPSAVLSALSGLWLVIMRLFFRPTPPPRCLPELSGSAACLNRVSRDREVPGCWIWTFVLVGSPSLIQESKVKSLRGLAGYCLSGRGTQLPHLFRRVVSGSGCHYGGESPGVGGDPVTI